MSVPRSRPGSAACRGAILLDEGISVVAGVVLRDRLDVASYHVADFGLTGAVDDVLLRLAAKRAMVIATFDADFHRLLALSGAKGPSVIRFRMDAPTPHEQAALVAAVWRRVRPQLEVGPW